MQVELTRTECLVAAMTGVMRHINSVFAGSRDASGMDPEQGWKVHVDGALAEMAAAKALNWYWEPRVNAGKAADIGQNIQVRHTHLPDGCLIFRPGDSIRHKWVLVTGEMPHYVVRGWLPGPECQEVGRWRDPNDRPGAWFIAQHKLYGMESLNDSPASD